MSQDYVLVCASEYAFTKDFKEHLNKTLFDFNVNVTNSETKKNFDIITLNLEGVNYALFDQELRKISGIYRVDLATIPQSTFLAEKKLAIFDMDSTLITAEVIDEMALKHGVGEKVKMITVQAMNGELDFNQSLTERVALLKGFDRSHMNTILSELQFTPGTTELIQNLKRLGIKTAIASGGFKFFAESIKKQLQMDYVFANDLEFHQDKLTGNINGPIVNAERKAEIVGELAQELKINLSQIITVGDGANDIPMLLKAGTGIAVHAKEKVQLKAKYRINFGNMMSVLSYMNYEAL